MALPNIVIIGSAKSGTTSLFEYCRQHPEVFVSPIKEPRFFKFEGQKIDPKDPVNQSVITDFGNYKRLFEGAKDFKAILEASPAYMTAPEAPEKIKKYLPNVQLYLLVRNPIDRAFSHVIFSIKQGYEPIDLDLMDAIANNMIEYKGFTRDRGYLEMGNYAKWIKHYQKTFSESQLEILFFEDLRKDPISFAQSFFAKIGVSSTFVPETSVQYAKSGIPKNKGLHQLIKGRNPLKSTVKLLLPKGMRKKIKTRVENNNLQKPEMPAAFKAKLLDYYREDILELSKIANRDLSHWLQ